MKRFSWMAAVVPMLAMGCTEFEQIDFQSRSTPPREVGVSYAKIQIPQGIAVAVEAVPMDDDGEVMDVQTTVELASGSANILGLAHSPSTAANDPDEEERANWNFILFGASAGETTVSVTVDGQKKRDIPVTVQPQP